MAGEGSEKGGAPHKVQEYLYQIDAHDGMNVPLRVFASPTLLKKMQDDACLRQGEHVAALPGICGHSMMMPDAHQGYGFPIGGVAAMDKECGCLSPGGVGFDINCGMRVLLTPLTRADLDGKMDALLDAIFKRVPVGVGRDSDIRLTHTQLDAVARTGARWAIEQGYGTTADLALIEEGGAMADADPTAVSPRAKKRGKAQLGTLGAGNHFIEIQEVAAVHDDAIAEVFGLRAGQIIVMIHTGSRGFGHQICTDYLRRIEDEMPEVMASLPEKDLAYAPINSEIGQDYYKAMCSAMNFAWANRQVITARIREAFAHVLDCHDIPLLYDMSHNNAKLETHTIDGETREVWVHRKGAARAFGPGDPNIPEKYRTVGQPVLIPGSMGTYSYILAGTKEAMALSMGTTCHGAGRIMSRRKASELFTIDSVNAELERKRVRIKAGSKKGVIDEAPGVYKDVQEVVRVCEDVGIARIVVQLRPVGVIKG